MNLHNLQNKWDKGIPMLMILQTLGVSVLVFDLIWSLILGLGDATVTSGQYDIFQKCGYPTCYKILTPNTHTGKQQILQ